MIQPGGKHAGTVCRVMLFAGWRASWNLDRDIKAGAELDQHALRGCRWHEAGRHHDPQRQRKP
ncbi:MAG: hypothetical protein B7Y35_12400 [Sphingomonadales bacterium 28-64-96]|nr:MAG: hypothetical protein B7Y35_12400 [Sphingomonadales bacterium 28-64-96]